MNSTTDVISLRDSAAVTAAARAGRLVRIDRASEWGNPFRLQRQHTAQQRADVIARYEAWLAGHPELLARVHELRGKALACWCAPQPCHGDVLARLADESAVR